MTLILSEISIDCCKNGFNIDFLKRLLLVYVYMVIWRRKFELGKKKVLLYLFINFVFMLF